MWPDPDGLELQLFQPPAGLVTAAVKSPLPVGGEGLVAPLGVDHVLLQVSNLDRSLAVLSGALRRGGRTAPRREWACLVPVGARDARWTGADAPGGVRIAHYAFTWRRSTGALTNRLRELGARMLPAPDEPDVVRFADNNGIIVELRVASPVNSDPALSRRPLEERAAESMLLMP